MKYLAMAFVATGVLTSCGGDKKEDGEKKGDKTVIETKVTSADAGDLTIGYYNMEKLYTDFDYVAENNGKLQADAEAIQNKLINYQTVAQDSYNKMQQEGLSVQQQMAYDKKMQNAQLAIQRIQQGEAYDLQMRQAEFSAAVEEKLLAYSEEFGKQNGIKLIFARGANSGISYIDEAFDITDDFIKFMNAKEKAIANDLKETPGVEEK